MPLIEQGYGHATYTRTARKPHRCTHWKRFSGLPWHEGMECGAAILPGDPYVESVCAPYYESPFYKVEADPVYPWREKSRRPIWHSSRLCLRCAAKELRSFPEVRRLADTYAYPTDDY